MKKYTLFVAALLMYSLGFTQGYQVTIQARQYKSGIAYLTYYMGTNLNVADSAAVSNTGIAIFKGKQKLPGGIYVLVLPGKRLRTDFLIDKEQRINIKVDTTDFLNKTIVTGSKENILYVQYQKYVAKKGRQLQEERMAYMAATTKQDSVLHEANYSLYNGELNTYREGIIKNQPNSMMAALLKAMKDAPVLSSKPVTHQDSLNNYNFYKAHYWDGVSFMDERIIRSPFFLGKLERYYRDIMPQAADSIIKDADYKLLLARSAPEMYKFLLNWLTDEYINPKYMGQDAVFVHLFEKYHSKGVSNWLNAKQMESISRRAYMLMANLIGVKAANLEMIDTSGKPVPLYNIEADYTVICFWDPNCGHCKEEVPRLDSIYNANWIKHNVKIYAVLTPDDKDNAKSEWLKFITEHKLAAGWTHVHKTKAMEAADLAGQKPGFRQLYDITSTPVLYLLDKDKNIIGKKLTILQLNELLEVKWKTKP
jgi:thiol-disulfide isomerase/thioredoxin